MNKNVLISLLLIAFGQSITAQTYYYRYTKSIIKGVTNTNVSGGQFITFDGKKCFESDKFGNDVGNGSLAYDAENSREIETYWGSCYWSKNAYMKFNADKSLMNIETNAGKIYVYKRATPPAGVTTCSLIHEKEQSKGSTGGSVIIEQPGRQPVPIQVWVPCAVCGHNPGVCQTCVGMGTTASGNKCISCNYTGKCHFCDGKGGHYDVQYK